MPSARATLVILACLCAPPAIAQDPPAPHQHDAAGSPPRAWTFATDANLFAGFNYQSRKFADIASWESQNWGMASAARDVGAGRLTLHGMLSLEPLTVGRYVYVVGGSEIRAGGSPQLFQTGESFERTPIVHFQHPHDLFMGLGATYRVERDHLTYTLGADLVGTPTLGPPAFMHRASARSNPQAPLAHHFLDSTHITAGVVRGGVDMAGVTFEASIFRGEEPDEQRLDIDQPRLDSWAARVGFHRGPWQAQFSGGRLHEPEWFEPYDVTRFTASIGFDGAIGSRALAATAAWGQNREYTPFRGIGDAYLVEWDLRATDALTTYGRAESVSKVIGLGVHPRGFGHPHAFSEIDAVTAGAIQDLPGIRWGRFGLGADITLYRMSPDMAASFGGSRAFHLFLRWRPKADSAHHVH